MFADNEFTHVICGYSAAGSIRNAFNIPAADIVKCGDLIAVGRQNLHYDFQRWSETRMPELERALDADLGANHELEEKFQLFHNVAALSVGKPVLIWLDCSIASQLMAAFLCHVFKLNGWDMHRLHVLRYAKVAELYMGILDVLNENELRKRRPEVFKLKPEETELYANIWTGFAGTNLEGLVSVITDHDISHATMGALPVLRRRFPGRFNGLDEIDHELLRHIIACAPSAIHAIGFAMGHDETPDMVGDLHLFARLKHFAAPELKHPLIELDYPDSSMRDCQIRILPLAHEIFAGRANMIELNGLDEWLGGVHLTSENLVWREDIPETRDG